MNGCGDIEIKFVSREEWLAMPPDQKAWFEFSFMQSIAHTCRNRPTECNKKYVKLKHVAVAAFGIGCLLVGLGILQVQYIMPELIQRAVAAAILVP